MVFAYKPGAQLDGFNYQTACNFAVASPCDDNVAHAELTDKIKNEALSAYTAAFANLPAIVAHNVKADMLYGGTNHTGFEHTVYVDGTWYTHEGGPAPGVTTRRDSSWVFYLNEVNQAEAALGPYQQLPDFTPPFSDAASMQKWAAAVGRGIGNTAAHETAHQLAYTVTLPGLECGPGAPENNPKACQDGVNSVYEAASTGDWDFLPTFNPSIHCEQMDLNGLQKYFTCTDSQCN